MERRAEKRSRVAEQLLRTPRENNWKIAQLLGVSPHTVDKVRLELEGSGRLTPATFDLGAFGVDIGTLPLTDDRLLGKLRNGVLRPKGNAPWFVVRSDDTDFLTHKWTEEDKGKTIVMLLQPENRRREYFERAVCKKGGNEFYCVLPLNFLGGDPDLWIIDLISVSAIRGTCFGWFKFCIKGDGRPVLLDLLL